MITFNLFRPAGDTQVWCAVPVDQAVPSFLDGGAWRFLRRVDEDESLPMGFDLDAARAGIHFNGFYMFENFGNA